MVAPDNNAGQVNVRLVFDTVPSMGRHRVRVLDANGAVLWLTGGPCPDSMQFAPGDVLTAQVSIAAHRDAKSVERPSREWQLRVAHGGQALLRLDAPHRSASFDGVQLQVEGAQLDRRKPRR